MARWNLRSRARRRNQTTPEPSESFPEPTPVPPGPIVPEPAPPLPIPDPTTNLTVAATDLKLDGEWLTLQGDHITGWDHKGEGVSFTVHVDEPATISLKYDYVLAQESAPYPTTRKQVVGAGDNTLTFGTTTPTWQDAGRGTVQDDRGWDIPAGDTMIRLINDAETDKTNPLDLYDVRIAADRTITFVPED